MRKRQDRMTDRVLEFLRSTNHQVTYGEIARELDTNPRAVGQCVASIGRKSTEPAICDKVRLLRSAA